MQKPRLELYSKYNSESMIYLPPPNSKQMAEHKYLAKYITLAGFLNVVFCLMNQKS